MNTAYRELRAVGGQHAATANVHSPQTLHELRAVLQQSERNGTRLTLVGAQRSFGEQFLPPERADCLSLHRLGGQIERLEHDVQGNLWVRAPGHTTFHDLCAGVPGFVPFRPPTGDRISVAGALVACSHDAVGFFADNVRAITVMFADGTVHECRAGDPGVRGELFRSIPGSFGAFAAILSVELRLRAVDPAQRAVINVLYRGTVQNYPVLEQLETLFQNGEYALGRGLFFYGRRRSCVLVGDCLRTLEAGEHLPELLLTDDATTRNIVAQALANRFPSLAHRAQPWVLKPGRRFQAGLYGFSFYQRSYDRAFDFLSSNDPVACLLREVGVDPRLAVCHQTFLMPISSNRKFLDAYFEVFDRYPELEARLEQQDMVRLPPCPYPLHASHGLTEGSYQFTASF
ncbi:MAG TPA: FAD-binding protein, partial [Polyangiaceae bacterium]|nr:FAD-binding protein [Polyangiaceae bacterium]